MTGTKQTILNPPGGSPAGISSLPGLSGLVGTTLANLAGGLPGQVARFASSPLESLTVIAGTPRIAVTVSSARLAEAAGSTAATEGAVLFASMSKVSSAGTRTLAGSAVAPIRITGLPTNGAAETVQINLPAVAFQVEAGARIEVDLSTTDQAYAGPTSPAVYQVSLAPSSEAAAASGVGSGVLSLPEVGGVRVSAGDIPVATLIGLIILLVIAVVALALLGRVRSPRRRSLPPVPGLPGSAALRAARAGGPPTRRFRSRARLRWRSSGWARSYPGGVAAVTDVSFRGGPGVGCWGRTAPARPPPCGW